MDRYLEQADYYELSEGLGVDKNPLPSAYVIVLPAYDLTIHRGDPQAKDDAYALGHDPDLAAACYGDISAIGKFHNDGVFVLANGEQWKIDGRPSERQRGLPTDHIKMLLQLQKVNPVPIP